ncbi:MAG: phage tail tape measure protein [Chitinophagales bacterium]|nr:phage tail tape measure protein [Chitinophagales bacterium]
MADIITKWALEFGDRVSAPVKKMMDTVSSASKSFTNMGDSSAMSVKTILSKIEEGKTSLLKYITDLELLETEMNDLKKAIDAMAPGPEQSEMWDTYTKHAQSVDLLKVKITEISEELVGHQEELDKIKDGNKIWHEMAIKVNQTMEVAKKMSNALNFTVDYKNQKKEIERLTELSGDALNEYVRHSREIADVYGQDSMAVAKSVNAMTKQFGGSYEENFTLMEEGFKRGANLSGNLLKNMERYSGAFAEMGVSADQAMVIMAKAEKEGIDGDKAVESLKRASDAIKEMGPGQKEALKQIGVDISQLTGKSAWEAVQTVSKAMEGMNEQAKQNVLAKVFGEAGKESGIAFVQNLSQEIPDLSTLPEVEESASGFKKFFSNVKSWAGDAFGEIGIYATQLSPTIEILAGAIPIIDSLRKSQALWNIVTLQNPIFKIVIIVAALITFITIAIKKWDEFGAAMMLIFSVVGSLIFKSLLGPFGIVISVIKTIYDHWQSIVTAFRDGGILEGLKRIGEVIMDVILKPLQQILETIAKFDPTGLASKGAEAIKAFRQSHELETAGEKEKEKKLETANPKSENETKKEASSTSVNDTIQGVKPTLLTFSEEKDKGKNTSKEDSGMSISGKSGASNITMTINNYFTAASGVNIRQLADQVAGKISDRLQDAIVSV